MFGITIECSTSYTWIPAVPVQPGFKEDDISENLSTFFCKREFLIVCYIALRPFQQLAFGHDYSC